MTAEHLLDAMGLLDDDLIREAERASGPRRRVHVERWLGLAASLALVIALGYGAVRLGLVDGMKGGAGVENASGGAAPMAPAGSGPASSVADTSGADAESGDGLEDPSGPEEQPSEPEHLPGGSIQLEQGDAGVYLLTGSTADLPEGAVPLGALSALASGSYPATSAEDYVGLELWAEGDGTVPDALYVQLPDGRYAAAERVEP